MSLFGSNPFYHEHIKKFIVAFGSLFTGLSIVNYDQSCNKEQILQVPIAYGPKNKWLTRLAEQPNLTTMTVRNTLPRLCFEVTDIRYDPERKVGTVGSFVPGVMNNSPVKVFNPVPYNLVVNLYSLTKDQGDSLQILEQILPYFAPTLDLKVTQFNSLNMDKTIPVQLNSVSIDDSYADNNVQSLRTVIQTFSFTAKMDFFGPIFSKGKEIKRTILDYSTSSPLDPDYEYRAEVDPFTAKKEEPWSIKETWEEK